MGDIFNNDKLKNFKGTGELSREERDKLTGKQPMAQASASPLERYLKRQEQIGSQAGKKKEEE